MMFSPPRHAARDLEKELVLAYEGEVPPPYYWRLPAAPAHHGRHHPGEIETALPYAALPVEFLLAGAISLEQLDEALEQLARQEESSGWGA